MEWDGTAHIAFPMGPMGQYYITELSLSETVDEQATESLLNENSDSKYECQNNNEMRTLLNFKVNKVNKFCRFVSLFVRVVPSSTHYTKIFINLLTFIKLYFDGNPMGWDRKICPVWTSL